MGRKLRGLKTKEGFTVYVPADTPDEMIEQIINEARATGQLEPETVLELSGESEPDVYYGESGQPFDEPGPGRVPARMGGGHSQGSGGLEITMAPERMGPSPQPQELPEPKLSGLGGGAMGAAALPGIPSGEAKRPGLTGNDYASGLITSGMQGLMGEFGDEFLGAASATFAGAEDLAEGKLPTGEGWVSNYQKYRDRARSLDKEILAQDPWAGYGVRIGGALATGVGALPKLARGAISRFAPDMAARLVAKKGATSLPGMADRAVDAATQGAIAGGITGLGSGEGPEGSEDMLEGAQSRLASGAFGTGLGTVLGVATPVVMAGGGQMLRGLRSLGPESWTGAKRRAAEIVGQDMGNTVAPPQQLPTGASQPSPAAVMGGAAGGKIKDLAIADVSDQARRTLGHVARGKGAGAAKATKFMRDRQHGVEGAWPVESGGGQWVEVKRHIKEVISGRDISALLKKLGAGMNAQAKKLYGKAWAHGDVTLAEAQELASLPDVQRGLRQGLRIAQNNGEIPASVKLPKDGSLILPVEVWHAAKVGVDDMIGDALKSNKRHLASSLITLKNRINDMLNDATGGDLANNVAGDYTIARTAYAGAAAMKTAAELGKEFMDASVSGGDIAEHLAKLSDLEKQFYLASAADAMIRKLESLPTGADVARKFFNTPQIKNKLAALTQNEADYSDFMGRMKLESEKFKTAAELEGSQTAQRTQVGQAVEQAIDDGVDPVALVTGSPVGTRTIMTWMQDAARGMRSYRVKEHLVEMLSTTDPVKQREVAKLISDAAERILARRRMYARVRGGLLEATGSVTHTRMKENPAQQGFRYSDKQKGGDGRWWRPKPGGTWEEGPFEAWR